MEHDVFISYGREDMPLMQQVETRLREAGFTIWTDRGIAPGSPSWKAEIEKAILDARCIVVLFSPDSAESRWVRAELDYADAQRKPIYPLLVRGDATKAVPFGFTSYQWIDVRNPGQLQTGLDQLVAVLKGGQANLSNTASPTLTAVPERSRMMIMIAVGLILAGLILGLVLLSINTQTPVVATPTLFENANAAFAQPTALPTMPPFSAPDGFKKLEGKQILIAIPDNWSTNLDPSILKDTMIQAAGDNPQITDMVQIMMDDLDGFALDMFRIRGVVITVEDIGATMPYKLIETRQREIYQDIFPNGKIVNKRFVDLPAGTMLVMDISDAATYERFYALARGAFVYTLTFSSRLADKDALDSAADTAIQSFRVKE
jgi:hypothetical protein